MLKGDDSFAEQLPNKQFLDTKLNQEVLLSGPPNLDSDSEFNRNSSMMAHGYNGPGTG